MAALDQLAHVPVEEREDQRADVGAVHVGVRHHDHVVVAELRDVELVENAGADRRDHRLDLGVREHLVDPVALGVDHLPAQRQDRLEGAVAGVLGGAAGRVALDEVELGDLRVADRAVGELAGQRGVLERALAPRQLPRLPRRLAGVLGGNRLPDDLVRVLWVLLEKLREPLVDGLLDEARDARVPELRLRLTLELRVLELDRDDRGEPLADVLALECAVLLLDEALLPRVAVEGSRQRRTEPLQVRAAVVRVDVVREREHGLDVRGVPLHRDLDVARVGLAVEVRDPLVHRVLRVVHVRDEVTDPALVVELVPVFALSLVDERDAQAARQEGRLAQPLDERLDGELELLEDLGVGKERDRRPGLRGLRLADHLDAGLRDAAGELLPVDGPVTTHLRDEPLRERVDDRESDAVEPAGHLVALTAELAAGVKLGQDDGERREALIGHHVDRNTRAPVRDGDRVVRMEPYLDPVVSARERLVDRVVHDLVDEVVEAPRAGRADVHPGSQPDGLETLENRDVLSGIGRFRHPLL